MFGRFSRPAHMSTTIARASKSGLSFLRDDGRTYQQEECWKEKSSCSEGI